MPSSQDTHEEGQVHRPKKVEILFPLCHQEQVLMQQTTKSCSEVISAVLLYLHFETCQDFCIQFEYLYDLKDMINNKALIPNDLEFFPLFKTTVLTES